MRTKYVYITSREYTNAVYQTQIIDWLNLYLSKGVEFELWHVFYQRLGFSKGVKPHREEQLKKIGNAFEGKLIERHLLPYRRLRFINKWRLISFIKPYFKEYDRIVIFTRDMISPEIDAAKKRFGSKVVYYLDLRGAIAEEMLLTLKSKKSFSLPAYKLVASYAYYEYHRQKIADKIFCVSNTLKDYYVRNYDADKNKFILYPCLSSSKKFYYSPEMRKTIRKELGVRDTDNLYIYSGGLRFTWHIPDTFLRLFIEIAKKDENARLLIMSPTLPEDIKKHVEEDPFMKERIIFQEAVPNEEVVKYLNTADFGFLLRENNPVNNVASPSKYAEYILSGLPTIISEGIFDYARFCKDNACGYVLPDNLLDNMGDIIPLKKEDYNREQIAQIGKDKLSKESAVDRILSEMTSFDF